MDDYKLNVIIEDGSVVEIEVLDIVDSNVFNKSFVIYTVGGNKENIFASILNEGENDYSLDTIEDAQEIDFINSEIDRIVEELTEEDEEGE